MRILALLALFACCFATACDDIAVPEPEDMSILPGPDDMEETD
jgi:hypothetical protein